MLRYDVTFILRMCAVDICSHDWFVTLCILKSIFGKLCYFFLYSFYALSTILNADLMCLDKIRVTFYTAIMERHVQPVL
jgi:hypothetical protein